MPWLILSALIFLLVWTFLPDDDVVQEADPLQDSPPLLSYAVAWLRRHLA